MGIEPETFQRIVQYHKVNSTRQKKLTEMLTTIKVYTEIPVLSTSSYTVLHLPVSMHCSIMATAMLMDTKHLLQHMFFHF
jgi:hypothetical protein